MFRGIFKRKVIQIDPGGLYLPRMDDASGDIPDGNVI